MDIEKLGKELTKSGKTDRLKAVADSADAKRLSEMLDGKAVERAALSGDSAALQSILRQVMETDEGKRLAKQLSDAMK
ncbi:MAG: hypothetical protein RR314_05915 [Oscillospiraceae bacterium]